MASKGSKVPKSSKRKEAESSVKPDAPKSKKPKLASSKPIKNPFPVDPTLSKRERRIQSKELVEARKMKRRPHYNLEIELAMSYEKMRLRRTSPEDRSKMISEALQKMKGKIPSLAETHVGSRVLQLCLKHCTKAEKDAVFQELQPHFFELSTHARPAHVLNKMLDASKQQLAAGISSLRGHVETLICHPVGSAVLEYAYHLGNSAQKQQLIGELYSKALMLFKDMNTTSEKRVVDVIAKLRLSKTGVIRRMSATVQKVLEKGIVDHTITHKLLFEYLTIADKTSAEFVLQQLTGELLKRMVHTLDGSRIAMLCIKHGGAKERKKIIKAMKGHFVKMASDQFGSMVLACIFSMVDDTKLMSKAIVRELEPELKDLVMEKHGRKPLLQLLHPNSSRYFSQDELASLDLSVPSLCSTDKESGEEMKDEQEDTVTGSKKDPLLRRQELLVNSGLAERLIDVCVENAEEALKSSFGKEIMYEIAVGGYDGILLPSLSNKLDQLYEAIASVAAKPKPEEPEKNSEHILENFHSSRTVRRLVLDCPSFASALFKKALSGKCRSWAQGHGSRIISAFLETKDVQVREMAKEELQVLVDEGVLKIPETKKTE